MTAPNETVQKNAPKRETGSKRPDKKILPAKASRKRAEKLFRGQASDIAKLILLGTAGLTAVFDDPASATAVMGLVTAEAAAGLLRERSCVSASERIEKSGGIRVRLRRGGELVSVTADELKEGDIFEISEGGIFPCDSLIIEQQELACDESILTGSSQPAEKVSYAGEETKDRLGLKYIGYSGTSVIRGRAVCKAAGHGSEAFRHEKEERERGSSLVTEERIRSEKIFTAICAVSSAVIAAAGMIRGGSITRQLSLAVTAAAVCIPEKLTASSEITSSRLRNFLFRKGIIIKDTAALERLGDTELILADLRGTVTDRCRNVRKLYIPSDEHGEYDYSEITGRLTFGRNSDGYMAWENTAMSEALICAAVCSKARRARHGDNTSRNRRSYYEGDSDDAALLALCSACGIERELLLLNKISEKELTDDGRNISVTCRVMGGEIRIYIKGDPETVFGLCGGVYGSDEQQALGKAMQKAAQMAEEGMGVTAFCETSGGKTLLLGMAGLNSPVRQEVSDSIRSLRRMGVRTLMFSDDSRPTANAAAAEAGIITEGKRCCTGSELDEMTDEQFEAVSGAVTAFSRAEPRHKARVAEIYENSGICCAASASSANEAALLSGTQALIFACDTLPDTVRQQAEVLIPQRGMEKLPGALRCGRAIYSALLGRACAGIEFSAAVMVMLLTSSLLGIMTPLLPVQLLLSSVLTGTAAAEALALLPCTGTRFNAHSPNDGRAVGRKLFFRRFFRGCLTAFSVLGCFTVLLRTGSPSQARTGAFAALTLSRLMTIAGLCGREKLSVRSAAAIILSAGTAAAAAVLPFPARLFGFSGLSPLALFVSAVSAVIPSVFMTFTGLFRRRTAFLI